MTVQPPSDATLISTAATFLVAVSTADGVHYTPAETFDTARGMAAFIRLIMPHDSVRVLADGYAVSS